MTLPLIYKKKKKIALFAPDFKFLINLDKRDFRTLIFLFGSKLLTSLPVLFQLKFSFSFTF